MPPRKPMVTEERTIGRIEAMRAPARTILLPLYLVASFWPWWLTLFVPAIIAWRLLPDRPWLMYVAAALGALAVLGGIGKGAIERALED